MSHKKIIVVGAGMVGLSSAYFLNQQGHEVIVIDDADGSRNCSIGNAGFFCPSHVVPLAAPGIITQGLKWMLNEKSPFYIKPQINLDLFSWGWKFKKAATRERVQQAAPLLNELTHRSQALVEKILEEEGIDAGYMKSGLLMLCKSQKELGHEIEGSVLARSFGQKVEVLSANEARELNPGLMMDIAGAVYYPHDTMITPHVFVRKLQEKLAAKGVRFLYHTRAESFDTHEGKIITMNTSEGPLEADHYVVAAGSWTSRLLKPLGLHLPMQGGKGYSFSVPLPAGVPTPQVPAILADGKVSMSPMMDGLRFSGTMEIDSLDPKINQKRIEGIVDTVTGFLPQFKREHFQDLNPWAGFRPCTPDGLPYIGKSRKYKNLTITAGHAMLGITLGPVSGEIVTNLISEKPETTNLSLLNVDRYE